MQTEDNALNKSQSLAHGFPRVCIERFLPADLREEGRRQAMEENPANSHPGELEGSVVMTKLWRPGRTLRVRFLDGDPAVQQQVEEFARQWTQYANIHFDFGDHADAEIRISFQQPGSWSAIGTDALVRQWFPLDEPTMNYGWLTPDSTREEFSRVVLHEFGHALGMPHEHQQPAATIQWSKDVVYRDLGGPPNNWDKDTIDFNIFNKYSREITAFTAFDPNSIMLYSFPPEWTLDGQSFHENSTLSATDKAFIGSRYPPAPDSASPSTTSS